MKNLNLLFTALLLLCCVGTATAHDFEAGGIYYNILSSSDKTVAVTYRGSYSDSYSYEYSGAVTIPTSVIYDGTTYSVTSIGAAAFYECTGLKSITIPNSVTIIGNYAFEGCTGLKELFIEDGEKTLSLGYNHNSMGTSYGLFYDCPLETLYLGRQLSYNTDRNNHSPFYNNTTLTSVTIGNSVTSIGEYTFYACNGLKEVHISDIAAWCGIDFDSSNSNPLVYAKNLYLNGEKITSLVIPDGVTNIGDYAFSWCEGLTSVTIPNSVTSIGSSAFKNCTGLKTVINLSNYTFSKGSTDDGYVAYYADKVYNARNGSIEGDFIFGKPNDVNTLLYYLGNTVNLVLPADYKGENYVIGDEVFAGRSDLTSITIPNSVTSIGRDAFYDCTGLEKVCINDLVAWCGINFTNAYGNPLYYAKNLYLNGEKITSLVIPNGVTNIKFASFYGCTGITSIEIPNSVKSIGKSAFRYCTGLTSITIPNSITSIGDYAFEGCTGLTSITIPNGVTSIGNYAFEGCSNIETLYISSTIESIGIKAFDGCDKIKEIKVGAEKPIRVDENIFTDAVYDNATLYIPKGTKSLYEKREPWNTFFYIVEMDYTGIENVKAESGEVQTIYDLNGRAVENPTKGVYIIDGKKVLVK